MIAADHEAVRKLITLAKREDLGAGDLTTALLADPEAPSEFRLLAREPCIFAGREIAAAVLQAYDNDIEIHWSPDGVDGARIEAGATVFARSRVFEPSGSELMLGSARDPAGRRT